MVVSARRGVTRRLRRALHSLSRPRASELVRSLARRHPGLPPEGRRLLDRARGDWPRLSVTVSPAEEDRWLSLGERLAAHWAVAHLRASGLPAVAVESDALGLMTDGRFGAARVDLDRSRARVRRRLLRILAERAVPVVTGYFGKDSRDRVTTLGPGGSDYSATALAALLRASRVDLVKSRFAILTADPAVVRQARPIRHLSYSEAGELAQFGASVLHPGAIEPARRARVPIWVRTLGTPSRVTSIDARPGGAAVRSVAWLGPLLLARVGVPGGRARPGVVRRLLEELETAGANVAGVTTTESSVRLLVDAGARGSVRRAVARAAGAAGWELPPLVRVCVVTLLSGEAYRDLVRLPRPLLRASLAVDASARSISFVLPVARLGWGCRVLHRRFVESGGRPRGRNT